MSTDHEVYSGKSPASKEGHRKRLKGPLQGQPYQGTRLLRGLVVTPVQDPRGEQGGQGPSWATGLVKATKDTELRTFLCPDGAEAKPRPQFIKRSQSCSQARCLFHQGAGPKLQSASFASRSIEVGGELEAECSEGRGCCSSRFSPLAEGQASWEGASGRVLTPQQLQAQALRVHFYQVDAVVPKAL